VRWHFRCTQLMHRLQQSWLLAAAARWQPCTYCCCDRRHAGGHHVFHALAVLLQLHVLARMACSCQTGRSCNGGKGMGVFEATTLLSHVSRASYAYLQAMDGKLKLPAARP
jgi:hypothetical protein